MGSPAGTPEATGGVDEAFAKWEDAYTDEHGAPYAQGHEMRDAFRAGWEAAFKFRAAQFRADRDQIDAEEQAEMAADPDYIAHQGRWCGKFYGIAPGVLHHKDSCYK